MNGGKEREKQGVNEWLVRRDSLPMPPPTRRQIFTTIKDGIYLPHLVLKRSMKDAQECTWCHRTGHTEQFEVWLATSGKLGYILLALYYLHPVRTESRACCVSLGEVLRGYIGQWINVDIHRVCASLLPTDRLLTFLQDNGDESPLRNRDHA